jgi:hypothetical protein
MSSAALAALFSPDSQNTLVTLLTIYNPDNETEVLLRIADNYTQRLNDSAEQDDIVYGIISRGTQFLFLPMSINLPSEEENAAPRCSIVLTDVTKQIVPIIREISGPPRVKIELVLNSTPNTVEVSYDRFYLSSISYNADQVSAELSMLDFAVEPFPAYSFTPAHFPGLF